jgi:hypothetical protein
MTQAIKRFEFACVGRRTRKGGAPLLAAQEGRYVVTIEGIVCFGP